MKYLLVLCVVIAAALADEKYTDRYDNINLQEILHNKKALNSYGDCILGKGKCTADGTYLKENIKDALETECHKCTEKQRSNVIEIFDYITKNERELYNELIKLYDPEGIWRKKYEEEAKKRGINLN